MNHRAVNLVIFALIAVYTICSISLVALGIAAYRNVRTKDESANTMRVSMEYIENKLRSSDIAGAVTIENRNGIDMLVMKYEGGDECETLVYFTDGTLYEMFKFTDTDIEPEFGTKLCSLASFDIKLENGAVRFSAEDLSGKANALTYALACAEGGR